MKRRIAAWASLGLFVAGFWAVYFSLVDKDAPKDLIVDSFARLTCPIALIRSYPLSIYLVLFANAVAYGLVGLIVETIRQQRKHAR